MNTLSYCYGRAGQVEIGNTYYFGQLWDGNHDGNELLESGAISIDNKNVVAFDIVNKSEDILQAIVKVTDIY